MNIQPTLDIHSVTDLKRNTRALLDQVHATGRPVFLTVNGKADAVLMDAATYERQQSAANLAKLLAQGEADVRAGAVRPIKQALRDLRRDCHP